MTQVIIGLVVAAFALAFWIAPPTSHSSSRGALADFSTQRTQP